jgi:hypothetical protein
VLLERAISKRAVESVSKPHGLRKHETTRPIRPTEMANPVRGLRKLPKPTPLALTTTISESPHIRAHASITPSSADIGKAISRKVGIMATNTVAICPSPTPRLTIREVKRSMRRVSRRPVKVRRLILKNTSTSFNRYRDSMRTG